MNPKFFACLIGRRESEPAAGPDILTDAGRGVRKRDGEHPSRLGIGA